MTQTKGKTCSRITPWITILSLFAGTSFPALAADKAADTEIKVTLFGQPCLLQGPFPQSMLKSIHAISPEQIYSTSAGQARTKQQIKSAFQKLRNNAVPAQLDRYKEQFGKRLQAQVEFFDAMEEFRISKKLDTLYAVERRNIAQAKQKDFEAITKKLGPHPTASELAAIDGALFESYSDGVEEEPEEEFHRAIMRAGIQYNCSFEEPQLKSPKQPQHSDDQLR